MTDSISTVTVTLPAWATDKVESKLVPLAKKALKLGVAAPTVAFTNYRERELTNAHGHKTGETEVVVDATLTYEEIVVAGGWRLLASIEKGELGNIIYSASGEDFSHLQEAALTCDHCNHKRVRKVHYVVGNEEGERMTVGSTCLKDFLGISPTKALNVFSAIRDFFDDEEFRGSNNGPDFWSIERIAAWVSREVELAGGFTSRNAAYNSYGELTSTSDAVSCNISMQNNSYAKHEDKVKVRPTEKDEAKATLIINHLNKSLETVEKVGVQNASDWDYKIANYVKAGYIGIGSKDYNVFVGAVGAALRQIDRDNERKVEEANPVGLEFVDSLLNANPKDRVEFTGTVIKVSEVENNFSYYGGSSTMVIIKLGNKDKNVKVRFYTTKDLDGVEENAIVKMSVKVKNRNDHPKFGTTINANYPKVLK